MGCGASSTYRSSMGYQSFRRNPLEDESLYRLDTTVRSGSRQAECPQRGFTNTFTKFWLLGGRGRMSGPVAEGGEGSW
jgi:hypothetical protein